jgi:predicted esterase
VEATLPKTQIPSDLAELGEPERPPVSFDMLRAYHIIIIASISDPVIPFGLASRVTKQLEARSVPFQLIEFDRRHSIYPGILDVYKRLYRSTRNE